MRYVIKNCDCYGFGDACLSNNTNRLYCKDISDCLIKRIVNKCKSESEPQYLYERDKITDEPIAVLGVKYNQGTKLAKKILDLLEIEECE